MVKIADIVIHFLTPLVSFLLLIIALNNENYILGLFSGIAFMSMSVNVFINNIPDLSGLENLILASLYFGVGAYIFIIASLENINENGGA